MPGFSQPGRELPFGSAAIERSWQPRSWETTALYGFTAQSQNALSGEQRPLSAAAHPRAPFDREHQVSAQTVRVGAENTPIIVIDDIFDDPQSVVDYAASLAPFPPAAGNFYPGLRRMLGPSEATALMTSYVASICRTLSNLMGSAYGIRNFAVQSVAFSVVTTPPSELRPVQTLPHIDGADPKFFAALHYLSHHQNSGTAFFRQVRTGFETVTPDRVRAFNSARAQDRAIYGTAGGYVRGSTQGFEEIGRVEARFNRFVVYPSNLFHSGILPADYDFDPDPRRGRLTSNIFLSGDIAER